MTVEKIEYYGDYLAIAQIAKLLDLEPVTLRRYYYQIGDIYIAVEKCAEKTRGKIQKIEYENGEMLPISVIAKREEIALTDLNKIYNETKNIFEAVKRCKEIKKARKERKEQIEQNEKEEYYGQKLRLREIATIEGIDANKLRVYFRDTKDVYKAVFMAEQQEQKERVVNYPGISVDLYDLSLLIGVKYTHIINLLNNGFTIAEIKEKYSNQGLAGENIKLPSGQTLLEFCISEKLKFDFMYRAIYTYGRTIKDASAACRNNSKCMPTTWVYEKYDEKLNKLGITGAQAAAILYDLQHKKMSLDEAIEGCIVRKNARKNGIYGEWGEVLYGLVQTRKILGQEFHSEIKINEIERAFLEACEIELKPQGATNPITAKTQQEDITHD